jgi:hypothetical protein
MMMIMVVVVVMVMVVVVVVVVVMVAVVVVMETTNKSQMLTSQISSLSPAVSNALVSALPHCPFVFAVKVICRVIASLFVHL